MFRPIKRIVWCVLFCLSVWLAGLGWFVKQIPTQPTDPVPSADAIVALTGGDMRVERGLSLLAQGKGKVLFVSGVGTGVTADQLLHSVRIHFTTKPNIVLGKEAVNTIGNAQETANWIRGTSYKSIVLVTSSYHMPRSISEFHELMPGIHITPAPVFTNDFDLAHWATHQESRELLLSEYHKYLASKLRHWFVLATQRL